MFFNLLSSNTVIDLVIVAIMLVFALFGLIKGFASMIVRFLAGIVSLFI